MTQAKRRFQFSLRTLVGFLLCYTILWGLTASWGVSTMRSKRIAHLQASKPGRPIRDDNQIEYQISISSPCPFIVCEKDQQGEFVQTERLSLWFFGFSVELWRKLPPRI